MNSNYFTCLVNVISFVKIHPFLHFNPHTINSPVTIIKVYCRASCRTWSSDYLNWMNVISRCSPVSWIGQVSLALHFMHWNSSMFDIMHGGIRNSIRNANPLQSWRFAWCALESRTDMWVLGMWRMGHIHRRYETRFTAQNREQREYRALAHAAQGNKGTQIFTQTRFKCPSGMKSAKTDRLQSENRDKRYRYYRDTSTSHTSNTDPGPTDGPTQTSHSEDSVSL